MNERFPGRVALVAGGTGGLGRAVSLAFLQEGAKVTVTYRKQEEFDALKLAAGAGGSRLEGHVVDVTAEASGSELVAKIFAQPAKPEPPVDTLRGYPAGGPLLGLEPQVLGESAGSRAPVG